METMNKKMRSALLAVCVAGACTALASSVGFAQSSSPESSAEAAEGSLVAYHESIGLDISGLTEVSYEACSECHGDVDEIRAETEDMWAGIGQISDANPHASHASNAFECTDCHVMTESAQVNVCNQCHEFVSPEGWTDMDPKTTIYGMTGLKAPYDTYRSTDAVK